MRLLAAVLVAAVLGSAFFAAHYSLSELGHRLEIVASR